MAWTAETLDAGNSIGLVSAVGEHGGQLHVFYDPVVGLRHARWDGSTWSFETLDVGSTRLNDSISTNEFIGELHTFYRFSQTGLPVVGLRHGWFDGTWHFETLDNNTSIGRESAASGYGPHLHVFTQSSSGLRHGWWNGSVWSFADMDQTTSLGVSLSVAVFDGSLHLFGKGRPTSPGSQSTLRHGFSTGGAWTFETLDAPASKGDVTDTTSYAGQLHVVSGDSTMSNQPDLRHGWFDGASWTFESLPVMCIGKQSLIAYDGLLHLFAREPDSGNLLHATWDGGSWSDFENLDAGASRGFDVSTAVHGGDFGTLHVFNAGYVSSQGNVFRHLSYSGVWQDIGHANDVVGMAAINVVDTSGSHPKLFCATKDNRLWARDPVLFEVNWQDIGHANNVVAMAAINGKLFCATSDNRLWARDQFFPR